jgi:hypothetical protein
VSPVKYQQFTIKKPLSKYTPFGACYLYSIWYNNINKQIKARMKMTRREKAEQVFRRLNVENRSLLLTYFETALEAEHSVKRSLGLTPGTGQDQAGGEQGQRCGKSAGMNVRNRSSQD